MTIYYGFDKAGRQISSNWSNGSTANQSLVTDYTFEYKFVSPDIYATEISKLSNLATETVRYNQRLQPHVRQVQDGAATYVMNLSYSFGRPGDLKNNGNVFSIYESMLTGKDQNFTYDYLNRITAASNPGGWSLTFAYDRYGNRQKQCGSGGAPTMHLTVSPTTNRASAQGTNCSQAPGLRFGRQHDFGARLDVPVRRGQPDQNNQRRYDGHLQLRRRRPPGQEGDGDRDALLLL